MLVSKITQTIQMQMNMLHSFQGPRILLLQQAATQFLRDIIENGALVGIVQFDHRASIKKNLTLINGKKSREDLVKALPTASSFGGTEICRGIVNALEVKAQCFEIFR